MTIRVIHPGQFATVQDLGRVGQGALGVAASGAADVLSLRIGNRLVGNRDGLAAVEMTLVGGTFEFDEETEIAVTGASADVTVTDEEGASAAGGMWRTISAPARGRVAVGAARNGARVYLCVRGGIETPPVLGSRATHVPSGLGGVAGRPLRAGDVLPVGAGRAAMLALVNQAKNPGLVSVSRRVLRVVSGAHAAVFGREALETLARAEFEVGEKSDRTGLRLTGSLLKAPSGDLITEGMSPGFIQVPPGGEPIVLGPDAPPTGGYPVIAAVASVDLPVLGQLRARDRVRFELIDLQRARMLYEDRERTLSEFIARIGG
ncbi:5-oxoprolinase subunit C [Phycisphaerales bacterium]|nr:5-oxoprolinase subunit C [Phycisphaerales bacterium]